MFGPALLPQSFDQKKKRGLLTSYRSLPSQADAENRPVYLESSSLANNAYYEKFGFVVKKDIFLKRGPVVQLSIMVREPQPPSARVANITAVTNGAAGLVKSKTTAAVKML